MAGFLLPDEEARLQESAQAARPASSGGGGFLLPGEEDKLRAIPVLRRAVDVNPDEAAQTNALSRAAALPVPLVQGRQPDIAREEKLKALRGAMDESPALARALADPAFANVAHDDVDNLRSVAGAVAPNTRTPVSNEEYGRRIAEMRRRTPALDLNEAKRILDNQVRVTADPILQASQSPEASFGAVASDLAGIPGRTVDQLRANVRYAFSKATGLEGMNDRARQERSRAETANMLATPQFENKDVQGLYSGVQSLVQQAPLMMTGSLPVVLGGMGVMSTADAFAKFSERGANPLVAGVAALGTGASEVLTELAPMGLIIKGFGKMGAGQFLTSLLGTEMAGEQVNTLVADAIDTAVANPNKTWGQYVAERGDRAWETALNVFGMVGAMGAVRKASDIVGATSSSAQAAEQDAKAVENLFKLTEASKVFERDKDGFASFLQSAAEDGPVQTVYVPATTFAEIAGDNLSVLMQEMPSVGAQMEEAIVRGGDLQIPVGEFVARLAGTGMESELIDYIRTSEEGMSRQEAKVFMQSEVQNFRAEAEKILATKQADDAFTVSAKKVESDLLAQLTETNRFTDDVNKAYASMVGAFYTTTAQRLGITPEELYQRYQLRFASRSAVGDNVMDQKVDLDTPEFKSWFVDSKAVNRDGSPLVAYHGTNTDFAAFDIEGANEVGSWFSAPRRGSASPLDVADARAAADGFAATQTDLYGGADSVVPVHLAIKNPRVFEGYKAFSKWSKRSADGAALRAKLEAQGFDGIVIRESDTDTGEVRDDWVAFRPEQIKSVFNNRPTNSPNILKQPLSTRVPTSVRSTENPLLARLSVGLDALRAAPAAFAKNIAAVSKYVNFPANVKTRSPERRAELFVQHAVDNLLWLYDQVPAETRERSKLWYVGANAIANDWAAKYGITPAQASGVLAVLSPQKDWFQNVSLAERILNALAQRNDFRWDSKMQETADRIYAKPDYAPLLADIRGKTLGETGSSLAKAMWIRTYDEAYNTRAYRLVTPEGAFGDWVLNDNGKRSAVAWGSNLEIAKAVSVALNGEIENIHDNLGLMHKVRSFYNNIFAPNDPQGEVTIDTHAVAAALLRPLSGNSVEALQNFGGVGSSSSNLAGVQGTYALYAEAYRRAAAERGVLPRELQSITWEAVRGLFKDTFKAQQKNVDAVDALWGKWRKGVESTDATRQRIAAAAGGIDSPAWERSDSAGAGQAWASSYSDELRSPDVRGGGAEPAAAGSGGGSAGSAAGRITPAGNEPGGRIGAGRLAEAQATAKAAAQEVTKLRGLPDVPIEIGGLIYIAGPVGAAHRAAASYTDQAGTPFHPVTSYQRVDPERAKRIADAFDAMEHAPNDPEVKAAYRAMIDETLAQWQAIKATGLKVEFIDYAKQGDPYAENPRLALIDVIENNHLWVFPTDSGFGGVTVNVGLAVNGGSSITEADVRAALKAVGVDVVESEIAQSNTEPTMVARLSRALTPAEADAVSVALQQEAIAQVVGETGELYGPQAANWRPFNPDYFLTQGGKPLSQTGGNPLLEMTDEVVDGKRLQANDVFRIVHDYFGHIKDGNGFRADGEENAWRSHAAMYSPLARRAMTTETRGQNSWVNYGPHGETNRSAKSADTVYAPQKVGLLPEWVSEEGRLDEGTQPAVDVPSYGQRTVSSVSAVGVHFSHAPRATLDSTKYGTGMLGAERADVMSGPEGLRARTYFYVSEGKGVQAERGVGGVAHAVRLENLYDADSDPLKIFRDKLGEQGVIDAGFDGYYSRGAMGQQGVAVLLGAHEVPVTKLGFERDANAVVTPIAPPPAQYAKLRKVAMALVQDQRLPSGQLTPEEWRNTLAAVAPDLLEKIPAYTFASNDPVYRDELARVFYQSEKVTDTPEFKQWFGESKVVGENGAPLVVYHGTAQDFNSFSKRFTSGQMGFHFGTADQAGWRISEGGGEDATPGARVLPVYLSIKNPLRLPDLGGWQGYEVKAEVERAIGKKIPGSGGDTSLVAAIKAAGYDGVVYSNQLEGEGDSYIAFEPEQIKSAIGNDGSFDANDPSILSQAEKVARGQIAMAQDITKSPSTITLLEHADLSTFLHESGHFFLEVLTDIAGRPDAPAGIAEDMNRVLAWFGVPDLPTWRAMSLEEKRPHHEKFARGFEAYLFEGKSPNVEMQSAFQRFRDWLVAVYKQITNLDVKLTDEVRGVMDRLVATDEQIATAQSVRNFEAMFKTAQEMGATPEEFAAYQALGREQVAEAQEKLQSRSLRDMAWLNRARVRTIAKLADDAAGKRRTVEAEVRAEVRGQPLYAVQRFLRYGELPEENRSNRERKLLEGIDGGPTKLSLAALREMYGDGPSVPWRYLSVGKNGLAAADGVHPDVIAELFGFRSGDHLVRSILEAEPEATVIEGMTDQRMLERYGDINSPEALSRAADQALHNEARGRFLAAELDALNEAANPRQDTGKTATDSRGRTRRVTVSLLPRAARQFAESLVGRRAIRDVKPSQYEAAEARAARAAQAAQKAGKLAEATAEKRNQLVNHYAAVAAERALEDVEKGVAYMTRAAGNDAIDIDYREQIAQLLERFDLRTGQTLKAIDKRKALAEWITEQESLGYDPQISDKLRNEAFRTSYKDMTVEEFRGLLDAVENIVHLGRLKKKLLTAADQREFAAVVSELTAEIEDNATKTIEPERVSDRGLLVNVRRLFRGFMVDHRKFASLAREMDGWKDGGKVWDVLVRSMNKAGDTEAVMREKATIALGKLLEPIVKTGGLSKKMDFPALGKSYTREERIGIALNLGNEVNRERIMTGERLTEQGLVSVMDTLTEQDWAFVQGVWDYLETYRSAIGAKERRLTGKEPDWVEPVPVITKFGTLRGGYFPIKYDPGLSEKSNADSAAEVQKQLERGLYTRAQTRRGHTKARVESTGRTLRLDFANVLAQHVDQVVHDLSWHEFLIDANRLLSAAPVEQAIREHYGVDKLRTMKSTLTDIAVGDLAAQTGGDRILNYLRKGATVAGLGWRVTTSLLQPLGLTQSMARIGSKWVLRGSMHWVGDAARLENSVRLIGEKSDFMRLRAKTMQREINEIRNKVSGGDSKIEASYFYLIQKMQLVADVPTWWGAYEKAMHGENMTEERAIALADQAVRDAQGGGQIGDLARVQRGSPGWKLFSNFYSFFNTTYNMNVEAFGRTKGVADVPMLAVDLLLINMVPAMLGTLMKAALAGDWDDEDKLVRKLIADQVNYLLGQVMLLREAGAAVQAALGQFGDYGGPASVRFFSDLAKLGKQVAQGEPDEAFWKALNGVGGTLFHYPAGQINATVSGLAAMSDGETNPGVLLVGGQKN